jgi:hypothetical protein
MILSQRRFMYSRVPTRNPWIRLDEMVWLLWDGFQVSVSANTLKSLTLCWMAKKAGKVRPYRCRGISFNRL